MVEAREGRVGLECLEGDWEANACGCDACDTKHGHAHAPQDDPAHPFDTWVWRAPPLLDARRFADQMKLRPGR